MSIIIALTMAVVLLLDGKAITHFIKRKLMDEPVGVNIRHKKWVSSLYRTAQPNTLALFPIWGSQWELVVKDLPTAKVSKKR